MHRNVGSTEQLLRLGAGMAAAGAAMQTSGWPRAALGGVAAAGIVTGLSQYCPINEALGRDSYHGEAPLQQGRRDTELRRHTSTQAALGSPPSAGTDQPPVTEHSDVLGQTGQP